MPRAGVKSRNIRTALALLGVVVPVHGWAQTPAAAPDPTREKIDKSQFELRGIEESIKAKEEDRRRIEAEIESMRNDRARLASALIETNNRAREAEGRVADVEKRLDTAVASEAAIRRSLEGRRDVIAEVLAALQRIGRKPPPAVLASPDDILRAVRTSMLLGAVVPELRAETTALATDLADLIRIRQGIATEKESLARELTTLGDERQRIAALVQARQASLAEAQKTLDSETVKMRDLARHAIDLKDLIARSELEIAPAARGAEAARKAGEPNQKIALGPMRDPARLAPAMAFTDAKGSLPLPVGGSIVKNYGAPDGFGGSERGLSFATRASAIVSAPCDGWISYSGPWRTFGQLLIINAGGGYYIVLAGMDRINVNVGQFVLSGEPVATMGDGSAKTAAAIAIGAAQPILYVEFRKDGTAIDPGPWWAKPDLERVRG
jgi:septal ring factor EnvC (AmiA/AmiB activator)